MSSLATKLWQFMFFPLGSSLATLAKGWWSSCKWGSCGCGIAGAILCNTSTAVVKACTVLWMAEVCNLLWACCVAVLLLQGDQESPWWDSQPVAMDTDMRLFPIPCLLSTYFHEQAQGVSNGHGVGDQNEDTALPLTGRPPSWPSTEQEEGMPISLWLRTMAGCIVILQGDLGGLQVLGSSVWLHLCLYPQWAEMWVHTIPFLL